jgi:hypothetical protein
MRARAIEPTLRRIAVRPRTLDEYALFVPQRERRRMELDARRLEGLRVLHLSLPPGVDAVAAGVEALVALERGIGLESEWLVLDTTSDVAASLVGSLRWPSTTEDWASWVSRCFRVACALPGGWDVAVVHGAALAGVAAIADDLARRWIWQPSCTGPLPVGSRGADYLDAYACVLRPDVGPGAWIDPYDSLPPERAMDAIKQAARVGVGAKEQFVLHASRFGSWSGVAELLDACAERLESTNARIVAAGPSTRPSGRDAIDYAAVRAVAERHAAVTVVTGIDAAALWWLREHAAVVVRSADHRSRAYDVAQARWQRRAVVVHDVSPGAGRWGTGVIAASTATEAAGQVASLLADPIGTLQLGWAGHETVRRGGLVVHWLSLWLDAIAEEPQLAPPEWARGA